MNLKKKMSNKKKIILGSIIGVLIGTLFSVTYTMYTFLKTGLTNTLIAGDIYMRYKETTGLTLSNAMPSTTYDNSKYFEFDIIGKNTSGKDIWYEIVLTDGDKPNNKNTKLNDKFLKFTLFKGNTMVVNGASYDDITNQRLYTETVDANTNNETTTTYKLYMWIDNSLVIGNTSGADYTTTAWNDVWAAVKVNVNARTETKSSCFTISNKNDTNHTATISAYDVSCGGTDIMIPKVIDGYTITAYGDSAFNEKGLTNVIIQAGVVTIGTYAFSRNQLTSVVIPNSVTTINMAAFWNNQLTNAVIGNNVTTIGDAAFNTNQLTSIIIPNSVITIGNAAFQTNRLTSLTLGNSVTTIGHAAFQYNQLTSVVVPNSVTTIGSVEFANNQLTSITIGNGITSIDGGAFVKGNSSTRTINGITYYNNPNLTSITINKSCNDIKNNLLSNNTNYYPWLNGDSPYTGSYAAGATIYGANGEICDAY